MKLYESRLSYSHDKATINHCKPLSVHQHGGPSRPRQKCHSCIFETKENSNLRIRIQYLGHYSKTTCQKSVKSMRYRVRPKFEFYRKSLLILISIGNSSFSQSIARMLLTSPGHNQICIYDDVTHICKIAPTPRNTREGHFEALCCA